MPNKFGTLVVFILEFMIEQIFRNSYKEYVFARTVSKLAQFTPFGSINIPSKRELLIISAKCLPLYCASITSIYSLTWLPLLGVGRKSWYIIIGQPCAQLSKLILLTASKKNKHTVSRWNKTVYIPVYILTTRTRANIGWILIPPIPQGYYSTTDTTT